MNLTLRTLLAWFFPVGYPVQPQGQQAWGRGLQDGRGCARKDPDHVSEVRQPPCPASELCMDFVSMWLHLRQQPLTLGTALVRARSLNDNDLTNDGRDMSGILELAEALQHSQLTSLRWPTSP